MAAARLGIAGLRGCWAARWARWQPQCTARGWHYRQKAKILKFLGEEHTADISRKEIEKVITALT
jgi:hypothetical protein